MNIEKIIKQSFTVIGKEGSTEEGAGFIGRLWDQANAHFSEIEPLIIMDENGTPFGIWGAMSDMTCSFLPWQDNFSKGLYLAGAECELNIMPPNGWAKWIIPAYEYIRIEKNIENAFEEGLAYLKENNFELVGAVHEMTQILTSKEYLYFPIKRI